MTLHWWMHWFWVTAQIAGLLASPMPSTTQDPRTQGSLVVEKDVSKVSREPSTMDPRVVYNGSLSTTSSRPRDHDDDNDEQLQSRDRVLSATGSSFRVAKAISSHDTTSKANSALANNNPQVNEEPSESSSTTRPTDNSTRNNIRNNSQRTRARPSNMIKRDDPSLDDSATRTIEPDSRITWLLTTSKTPERRKKKIDYSNGRSDDGVKNFSNKSHEDEDLTVLPLRIEGARFKLVVNSTRTITAGNGDTFSTRTFNGSEDIEIDQELAEPRLSATAASILQDFLTAGISESTRLSRARNAFTSDFQRDNRDEDRSSDIDVNQLLVKADESVNREIAAPSSPSVVDIAAITGSCLATIVLLSTMGSLGFIMYRRKYLNPPQTLNSDKCSNPDSSGYIDDSTIRDNSEEMYSLDNDSFLNSLEAMTIQNYWTDSVKHTKL